MVIRRFGDAEVSSYLTAEVKLSNMLGIEAAHCRVLSNEDAAKAIENAKIFYDQSETEVQKAYASAAENARAAPAVNQSEYALFLSQNERKLFSLRELASAKCRLGSGVCYEPEANCNLLL